MTMKSRSRPPNMSTLLVAEVRALISVATTRMTEAPHVPWYSGPSRSTIRCSPSTSRKPSSSVGSTAETAAASSTRATSLPRRVTDIAIRGMKTVATAVVPMAPADWMRWATS